MSDTERILEIIRAKNLNNIQFCSVTGISPASLSHITSNRSKPTLTILRNVINGFPDISPEWIMMGTGPMFRNPEQNAAHEESSHADTSDGNEMEKMPSLFDNEEKEVVPVKSNPVRNVGGWATASSGNIEDIVKKTLNVIQKPQRKIVEVRIFFDDGTYESFGARPKAV